MVLERSTMLVVAALNSYDSNVGFSLKCPTVTRTDNGATIRVL